MRWVFLFIIFLACVAICWSRGRNAPSELSANINYPDRSEGDECGRIRIQVRRNTGPFRRLIKYFTSRVSSSRSDDLYMTSRLKLILDRLIQSLDDDSDIIDIVRGWSEDIDQADRLNLRYEGRSIRCRYGSNNGGARLRRLAGLAIAAGCDWVRNEGDQYITCCVKPNECRVPIDLTFMLDTSGSVGRRNHIQALKFIANVTSFFNIGPNSTQVSLIPFATYVHSYFFLNRFHNKVDLIKQIIKTRYSRGWTRTWKAMYVADAFVYTTKYGARATSQGVPRIVVLLTDGRSNGRNALSYVNTLKENGVVVFAVGIGSNIDNAELEEFASDPDSDHVFFINSYTDIEDFVNRLSAYTCDEPGVIPPGNITNPPEIPEDDFRYFQGMCSSYNQSNRTITIEETDLEGSCSLYVSADPANRNPGPLTDISITYSNTSNTVVKHVTLPSGINTTLVYIALRGMDTINICTVTIYDTLFDQTEYTYSLPEAVYNQQFLDTLQAEFRSGDFEYHYSIIQERDYQFFYIDSQTGNLTVSGSFNREERSEYRASVLVEDPRISCLKGRTTVILIISDNNDNAPIFSPSSYQMSIREDASVNSQVITVSASDLDSGSNAEIVYSFASSPVPSPDFSISTSGVVSVYRALDGNTLQYEYTLVATDGGQPPMSGTADLTINIILVNLPPAFTSCPSGTCEFSLPENTTLGPVNFMLSAVDQDVSGPDGTLTYSGGAFPFNINDTSGVLLVTGPLDRETTSSYSLTYSVSDGGSPSLSDTVIVIISVTDVNDNPPDFQDDSYSMEIQENLDPSPIFQVRATDADLGSNADIIYSLSGADSQYFSIDNITGVVSSLARFDFENLATNPLQFSIIATNLDGLFPVTATGTVSVTDLNDNSPVITGDRTLYLFENASISTEVFNLTITDADSGSNGMVVSTLVDGNQNGMFRITSSGTQVVVTLIGNLDFETARSHVLRLQASDQGNPARIASADLTLMVRDVNDNSPVCSQDVNSTLREDVSLGTQVGQVTATDKDEPNTENSRITYTVTDSSGLTDQFTIDSNGEVTTNVMLNIEQFPEYLITVTASDNGNPTLSCTSVITLLLEDVNEFPPVINATASTLNVTVREDAPIGRVIATVTANDPDFSGGQITYSLTSTDFSIVPNNGQVSVARTLDYETTNMYQLVVIASDGMNEQTAVITVQVINVNDITPTIDISSPITVAEDTAVNTALICFTINDTDGEANGQFSVSLSGPGSSLLQYNATSSCIQLAIMLDREGNLGDSFEVMITVNDNGMPNLHSTTVLEIMITDVNDNPPVFTQTQYTASIPENTARGTPVLTVLATDTDSGQNRDILYSINSTQFAINSNSGEITVNGTIDYELTRMVYLLATARDQGDPSMSDTAAVLISVTDVNDNAPQITNLPSTTLQPENGAANTLIFTVMSMDLDTGTNLSYSIPSVTPNDLPNFQISSTGEVTVDARQFDREAILVYSLQISVSDGLNSGSSSLEVTVTDRNDNPPEFISSLTFTIPECECTGQNFTLQTSDRDDPNTPNSRLGTPRLFNTNAFGIDLLSTNAIVISCTQNSLDFERSSTESFIVQATDAGAPALSTNATITIHVTDCNDNAPTIPFNPIEITLREDAPIETVVATFIATDPDSGPAGQVTFRQEAQNPTFFVINATTGNITLIRSLDYETARNHSLTIFATDNGAPSRSSEGTFYVTVENVNDNLPEFEQDRYLLSLPENTSLYYIYSDIVASDLDGDAIIFSVSGDSPFSIITDTSPSLNLTTQLDYEQQRSYTFSVNARNPNIAASVSTEVELTVLDVNDNSPIFTNSMFSANISEDSAVGTFVLTATAEDADSGTNGMFSFSFATDNQPFSITPEGVVDTSSVLDREDRSSYTLYIVVTDMGNPQLSSIASFVVMIEDVNDNSPQFNQSSYSGSVLESASSGTTVNGIAISASDVDEGTNAQIVFTDDSDDFDVGSDGTVSVVGPLDFETRTSYAFTVVATDMGSPPNSESVGVTVQVLDVNDNPPLFSQAVYLQSVEECNQLTETCLCERVVFTPIATDADGDTLTYGFQVQSGANVFSINQSTGQLSASCQIDREVTAMHVILLTVRDGEFTANASLELTVTDVNDNIPTFQNPDLVVQVTESTADGTELDQIIAQDLDIGSNGEIEFSLSLISPLNAASVVSISADGFIFVSGSIDFELFQMYQYNITATDRGSPRNSNTTRLTILVLNINDNAPVFDRTNYSISVAENSIPQDILCVSASDADSSSSSLSFFIPNQPQLPVQADSAFTFSGCNLSLNRSFDFEVIQSFSLFIAVSDGGSPPLTARVPLNVQVTDVNDNSPQFIDPYSAPIPISESASIDTVILEVNATDADSGSNGQVGFSLSSGSSVFSLTSDGQLRTSALLDFETIETYTLTIIASDLGNPSLSTSVSVTVNVVNENDNNPIFDRSNLLNDAYEFSIMEELYGSYPVGMTPATDGDKGTFGELTYSILSDPNNITSYLNSSSDILSVIQRLDREFVSSFSLTVQVQDGGNPPRSDTASVVITVQDINDNSPVFADHSAEARVMENVPAGTLVSEIPVSDADEPNTPNSMLTVAVNDSTFSVGFDSGIIRILTNGNLDRETQSAYYLCVTATDMGSPPLNATTTIYVTVVDVNDNAPVFTNLVNNITLPEDTPVSTVVASFSITDADLSSFTEFSISPPSQPFAINATGFVSLTTSLDAETTQFYNLTINATDGVNFTLATFLVYVTDVNEFAPAFPTNYTADISENLPTNSTVTNVLATDGDLTSELVYSLSGARSSQFQISATGRVSTLEVLNREDPRGSTIILLLQVTDSGSPTLFGFAYLTIQVLDENDNSPILINVPPSLTLPEDTPVPRNLTQIRATDADAGANAEISLSLSGSNFFTITPSGELRLVGSLDFDAGQVSYDLTITATDGGSPPLSTTAPIRIIVSDVNDNTPSFLNTPYSASVTEHSPTHYIVFTAAATDSDSGLNAELTFSLNSNPYFSIYPNNGSVFVSGDIDRELLATISVSITVCDNGAPPRCASQMLTVTVTDINDNTPQFEFGSNSITVPEGPASTSAIFQALATDADQPNTPNSNLSYAIQAPEFGFTIDGQGRIFAPALDFEQIQFYQLEISATDGGTPQLSSSYMLNINVTDINDNTPSITIEPSQITIPEDLLPSLLNVSISASDMDSGANGDVTFSLQTGTPFTLSPQGDLSLSGSLDYDQGLQSYTLAILARDNGLPSLSNSGTLVILIRDVNDNSPIFNASSYEASVTEEMPPPYSVLAVLATDGDFDSQVSYSLSDNSRFNIDNDGLITAVSRIDYEQDTQFVFSVIASDNGSPSRSTEASVIITVVDINDNDPAFQNFNAFNVSESASPRVLLSFSATDPDSGSNGEVFITLDTATTIFSFLSNGTTAQLSLSSSLDFESQQSYQLTFTAHDRGQPERNTTETLLIRVVNENDNIPVFNQTEYSASIREDAAIDYTVLALVATDGDLGTLGEVDYSLSTNSFFDITNQTPASIQLTQSVDAESVTLFSSLTVTACDRGTPPRCASATVSIMVIDVNDNSPQIFSPINESIIPVSESFPIGPLFSIEATDSDRDAPNNQLTYQIASISNNGTNLFSLNSSLVQLIGALDFEDPFTRQFFITVVVRDLGSPSLSAEVSFQLAVTDVNDNAPVISNGPLVVSVDESQSSYQSVAVTATDMDSGANGRLLFSISPDNFVSINQDTGVLSINGPFDFEQATSHDFTVTVRDEGSPSLTATTSLQVQVLDINDNSPVFTMSIYEVTLPESTAVNTTFLRPMATDSDGTASNNMITYSIDSNTQEAASFRISSVDGEISLVSMLDFESLSSQIIEFSVVAIDNGVPPLSASAIVRINVTDSNDNSPQISASSEVSILEGTALQTGLTTVLATDADSGSNALLTYSLTPAAPFSISQDGSISVSGTLDRETQDRYTLNVTVEDGGTPSLSSQATILVNILDRNDNAPLFLSTPYQFLIPENASINTVFASITVTDADEGINANLSCSLSIGGSSTFQLSANLNLATNALLDRETTSSYTLTVICQDVSPAPLISTATVDITVTDINDNTPQFPNQQYTFETREDVVPGTEIGVIEAFDADQPNTPNSQITFSISSGNPDQYFSINAVTGVLSASNTMGRIPPSDYTLTITASDSGSPPRSNTTTVMIRSIDVNDEAPSFNTSDVQNIRLSEFTPVGENVANFTATDLEGTVVTHALRTVSGDEGDFIVDSATGGVFVNQSLDFERVQTYLLEITAVDTPAGQDVARTATVQIPVEILDENDNNPIFNPATYQADVVENAIGPQTLVTLSSTDLDSGSNGLVRYSISPPNSLSSLFAVNSTTGVVTLVTGASLDYEGSPGFEFEILATASDQGMPPRMATTTLTISILDVNDHSPQIPPVYSASIREELPADTFLLRVQATDLDFGSNGQVEYSLDPSGSNPFSINLTTGDIFSTARLDRENRSSYTLLVTASDGGDPSLTNTSTVMVTVLDINDNCPMVTASDLEIREGGGSEVLGNIFQVSDMDIGVNGQFNYSIPDPVQRMTFSINPATGQLSLEHELDREAIPQYVLTILVTDQGVPACTATVNITVTVSDKNDNRATFLNTPYQSSITEGVPVDTFVICVSAFDPDEAMNGQFNLRLDGSDPFRLNSSSGCIFTAGVIDREAVPLYTLTVRAEEVVAEVLYSMAEVQVTVLDLNDNTPTFRQDSYVFTILDSATTLPVGMLVADDGDEGTNGELSFSNQMTSSSQTQQTYTFSVTDAGEPQLNSSTSVILNFPVCEFLALSTTNTNNEVTLFIRTLCSAEVELVSVFTVVNTSITLQCNVVGNSPFLVQWFRDGTPLLQAAVSSTQYVIDPLTASDEGDYSCAAEGEQVVQSGPFPLVIQFPPEITIPPRDIAINDMDALNLTCFSTGAPEPSHQWRLIAPSLETGSVVLPSEDAPGFTVTKNQITLPEISVEYEGFYSCNASNVVGYDEERGRVIIHVVSDVVTIGISTNFSNPDPNNGGCNNLETSGLEELFNQLTGSSSLITSSSGDSNLCDPSGGTTTTTTTTTDMCTPNPCNGYQCTVDPITGFSCDCPSTLTGPTCSDDIDECAIPGTCQNGALCTNSFDSFSCACTSGFTGITCEIPVSCNSTSCPSGTMCMDTVDGFNCLVTENVTINTNSDSAADDIINTANNEPTTNTANRRRRQTETQVEPAYRDCDVIASRTGSRQLTLTIGCLDGNTLLDSDYMELCQYLYDSFANFRTCTTPEGNTVSGPRTPPSTGVTITVLLTDPMSGEVIPGNEAVDMINTGLRDNSDLVSQLEELGFQEPAVDQIVVSSPAILLPFQYTAVVASVLVVLFVLVLIIIACMIVAICLKRRSHEDKTKSFQQSERVDPKQKPDTEVASSMEMGRVRDELPDSDYGIVEEAATTTFENPNSEAAEVPVKSTLAEKFSFKKDNKVLEDEESLVSPVTRKLSAKSSFPKKTKVDAETEAKHGKPDLGKSDSLPRRILAATTSFGKKKDHNRIEVEAAPLLDENIAADDILDTESNPIPPPEPPRPEKLSPKKKQIEAKISNVDERELVAGALVPASERDNEYKGDQFDLYTNVDVKADATMAQLWEAAAKGDQQEKKLIAGKKLITVQSQEELQAKVDDPETSRPVQQPTEHIQNIRDLFQPTQQPIEVPQPTQQPSEVPQPTQQPSEVPQPTQQPSDLPQPTQQPSEVPQPTQQPDESPESKPVVSSQPSEPSQPAYDKQSTPKIEHSLTYPWFHQDLDRPTAEMKLMQEGRDGTFLMRPASSDKGDYSLSVIVSYREPLFKHLLIRDTGSEIILQAIGMKNTFPHLAALVAHFSKEPMEFEDLKSSVKLLYPILNQ